MYANSKERLKYLSTIKKGWFDGKNGEPISHSIISRTSDLIELLHSKNILEPMIFPMDEGYLIVEWHLDNRIVTVDIEPSTYYLFCLDTDGPVRYTHKEDITDIQQVLEFIRERIGTYERQ